jgi:pectinesterase
MASMMVRALAATVAVATAGAVGCSRGGTPTVPPAPTTTTTTGGPPPPEPATTTTGATPPPAGNPAWTVAANGSARFRTVQAAIDAVPANNRSPLTITIAAGSYRGHIVIPAGKGNITLAGATGKATDVVLSDTRAAKTSSNTESATVGILADNVTVTGLTIANAYDEARNGASQAVALYAGGDRQVYRNVRVLGNQDTLLTWTGSSRRKIRQYFVDSYVEGDVDFIFGSGTAVFDRSEIRSLNRGSTNNNGYVTAAATDQDNPYGLLFTGCRFTGSLAANSVSLGRPWHPGNDQRADGQVTIRESTLGAHIHTGQPWTDMSGFSWKTDARFSEYRNTGPGAGVNGNRPQLNAGQAGNYTAQKYLAGSDGWNPVR